MIKSLSTDLIRAVNFMEEHFETNGMVMYQIDRDCLLCWHDVMTAFDNHAKRTNQRLIISDMIHTDHSVAAYEDCINRIGDFIYSGLYYLIIYDRDVLEKWGRVTQGMKEWIRAYIELNQIPRPDKMTH